MNQLEHIVQILSYNPIKQSSSLPVLSPSRFVNRLTVISPSPLKPSITQKAELGTDLYRLRPLPPLSMLPVEREQFVAARHRITRRVVPQRVLLGVVVSVELGRRPAHVRHFAGAAKSLGRFKRPVEAPVVQERGCRGLLGQLDRWAFRRWGRWRFPPWERLLHLSTGGPLSVVHDLVGVHPDRLLLGDPRQEGRVGVVVHEDVVVVRSGSRDRAGKGLKQGRRRRSSRRNGTRFLLRVGSPLGTPVTTHRVTARRPRTTIGRGRRRRRGVQRTDRRRVHVKVVRARFAPNVRRVDTVGRRRIVAVLAVLVSGGRIRQVGRQRRTRERKLRVRRGKVSARLQLAAADRQNRSPRLECFLVRFDSFLKHFSPKEIEMRQEKEKEEKETEIFSYARNGLRRGADTQISAVFLSSNVSVSLNVCDVGGDVSKCRNSLKRGMQNKNEPLNYNTAQQWRQQQRKKNT